MQLSSYQVMKIQVLYIVGPTRMRKYFGLSTAEAALIGSPIARYLRSDL